MRKWSLYLGIVVVGLLCIGLYPQEDPNYDAFNDKHVITQLRQIGHQLLLSQGDSTSRVLPVVQQADNVYVLRFEGAMKPVTDTLTAIFAEHLQGWGTFNLALIDSNAGDNIYNFTIAEPPSKSVVPCLGRPLPNGRYDIVVTFEKPRSTKHYILAGGALAFLILGWGLVKKPAAANTAVPTTKTGIPLGKYDFYPKSQQLLLDKDVIELTSKECEILQILAGSPNEVVERSHLQREVWDDDGVMLSRRLDIFISRLRKKLGQDPCIKITNAHGVGYKLELP